MARTFNPGKYREKVTLQRNTKGDRTTAFKPDAWADVNTFKAYMRPVGAFEQRLGGQVQGVAPMRCGSHRSNLEGVLTRDRLVWRGRHFNIDGPPTDPTGERIELEVLCTEES